MTLEQLYQSNEKFQKEASQLSEMVPGGNMIEFSSLLIRGSKKIDVLLQKLITAKSETSFHAALTKMEDEMDEVVYMLDRLDEANRMQKMDFIIKFIKKGYDLLSIYSMCCDQLIEKKIKADEFEND
ncbi:MAG: hypothetical protein ACJA08_002937 [Cyclobacteriaceae bacterium]|jgi:hypothetical protein